MTLDASHACVIDLDGVVWLEGEALPGARDGVALLRAAGLPLLFVTNNATRTTGELVGMLDAAGISASADEVVTSAQAAASLLGPGCSAYVVGELGLTEALAAAGVSVVGDASSPVDAVVVGLDRSFAYAACAVAARHVRDGARFLATNVDAALPTREGLLPGAGAIVAAIATASGRHPEIAGKPEAPMARLVASRTGVGAVIGDRRSTDGAFAARLGVPFVHVTSSVDEPPSADPPTLATAPTLLDAVETLLA